MTIIDIPCKLPKKASEALLRRIIFPIETLNTTEGEIKTSLLKKLYRLIPEDFPFIDHPHELGNELDYIYQPYEGFSDIAQGGMTLEQADAFIKRFEELPHPGYAKYVALTFLEGLLFEIADFNKGSMKNLWHAFHRIQTYFHVEPVAINYPHHYDQATQHYLFELLRNSNEFIDMIESDPKFSLAVVNLFKDCPTWLDLIPKPDGLKVDYEIYDCVFKLLRKHNRPYEASLLIDTIQDPDIKVRFKPENP